MPIPHSPYKRNPEVRETSGDGTEQLIQPNAENHYKVRREDVPLSCPMPGMYLWNSHPKVYLPIEASGQAKCPYCGASYALIDGVSGD
jgi:uncharacterized Zn-finger protein